MMMIVEGNTVKHQFDLVIKSKNSDVTLIFNPVQGKWEALAGGKVVIARRKNVAILIAALNSESEAA